MAYRAKTKTKAAPAPTPKYKEDKTDVAFRFNVTDKSGKSVINHASRMTPLEAVQLQQEYEAQGHKVDLSLIPVNKKNWKTPSTQKSKPAPTPNGTGLSPASARGAKKPAAGTPRRSRARGDAHYVTPPTKFGVKVPKIKKGK